MDRFKINNTEIRTLKGVSDFFRRNSNIEMDKLIFDNIKAGYALIKMHESLDVSHFISAFEVIQSKEMPGHKVRDNIKELSESFDGERFKKYVKYRLTNKTDSNSDKFYHLKWGLELGNIKKENAYSSRVTPYKVEYWVEKGFSEKEALVEIDNFKSSKATSEKGFIERHGEKKGLSLFKEFQDSSKHTKEKYIQQHGEDKGKDMWDKYVDAKKETSVFTSKHWINKGYSKEDAEEMRKKFHTENLNTSSVDYWISKGLSKKESINKVEQIFLKKQVHFGRASKESLVFFQPLFDKFSSELEVLVGIDESKELGIYDEYSACMRFYDFSIPERKIIIEYHGERYHPNPERLSKEEWKNWESWRLKGSGINRVKMSADEIHNIDQRKKDLALEKGYKYLELWSSSTKEVNNEKVEDFLLKNNIK